MSADDQEPPSLFGRRLTAFLVDGALAVAVAFAFTYPDPPMTWGSVVLFLSYTAFTGFVGQTPGMKLLGLACVRVGSGRPLGVFRAALRALLLQLVIPALVMGADGRGWHDKAAGAIVIRA